MKPAPDPVDLAQTILNRTLEGSPADNTLLDELVDQALSCNETEALAATRALFAVLVERLADLFEPRLALTYAELFARVCEHATGLRAKFLIDRYHRVRSPRCFIGPPPAKVFVLSRVTLGADVAVTSVLLDAARKRFPSATLVFVGPPKNCELFAGDPRVYCLPFSYGRRSLLKERLSGWEGLRARLDDSSAIILDPDSRLTQLGLLPVCREENYFLFESRAYGGDSNESLPALARRWSRETFGVENASPYICPAGPLEQDPEDIVTVSLGVGGNDEKRMRDPFEAELLKMLADGGRPVLVDKGAGDEETDRVERAVRSLGRAGSSIRTCQGPFAPFAARVARSALYVGYDSSGQHVAAASAVPLVTVFAGYASERTFARWRPSGEGPIEVIRAGRDSSVEQVLNEVGGALNRLACFTPERRIAS